MKKFLITLLMLFSFYFIYDDRMNPIYRVECNEYTNICKVYDMRWNLKYIINPDGKITDDRLNPKGGIGEPR